MSRSIIPRGFSRYYVLSLLKEKAMRGKEIIDETEGRTKGAWRPSPGLVYPLLGKLLSDGLIEEVEGGYKTTAEGERLLERYGEAQEEFERRFSTLMRLGLFGRFMAQDLADRLIGLLSMVREDISRLGAEQRAKYKAFLQVELHRLEEAG